LKRVRLAGVLLLSLLLSNAFLPALAGAAVHGGAGSAAGAEGLASSAGRAAGCCDPCSASEPLGFKELFYKCWSAIAVLPAYGMMILSLQSGSGALLSESGRYAYFAESGKVHVVDVAGAAKGNVSYVRHVNVSGSFSYSLRVPRPLARGPNDTVVAAPHYSNPYVVTPWGSASEVKVYNDTRYLLSGWLVGNGSHFAWSSSKGLAAFRVGKGLNASVLWRVDAPDDSLSGVVAVSRVGVAAVAGNGTLYIFGWDGARRAALRPHSERYLNAAAPVNASYFYALTSGGTVVRVYPDGTVANITSTSYRINWWFTYMDAVSAGAYDVVAVLYNSFWGIVVDVMVVGSNGTLASMKSFKPVWVHNVVLRGFNGTVYFAASGHQLLLGVVNGTSIRLLTVAGETKGKPFLGGFFTYESTSVDVRPLSLLDILIVDMLGDWGCGRVRVYRPTSLSDEPHVELRGKLVVPTVVLMTGNATHVPLGSGEMLPLGVRISVNRVVRASGVANLVTGSPYAVSHDVSVRHSVLGFVELARSQTAMSAQSRGSAYSVEFDYKAVWHPLPFATGSVPAPSMIVVYHDLVPTRLSDYDSFLMTGRVTSTLGAAGGQFSAVYGYGLAFLVEGTFYLGSALVAFSNPTFLDKIVEEVSAGRIAEQQLKLWKRAAEQVDRALQGVSRSGGLVSVYRYPDGVTFAYYRGPDGLVRMIEWPPIEELALGALAVMPSGILRASLPSDVLDRAARAGITREQVQSALGRAVRDAAQDALAAAGATVSVEAQLNSFIATVAGMLQDMQQYGVAVNASGALRRVDPQAASVFTRSLVSAIGYYANFVAVPYGARFGTSVTPQPSLNTLRDVYYWSKQILVSKGYGEEDAGRMAVFPVVLVYVAAVHNATLALADHLRSRGAPLTEEEAATFEWYFILTSLAGAAMGSLQGALAGAFPPPPSLVAEYFEHYLGEMTGAAQSSARAQAVRELAREVAGATVRVHGVVAVQGVTATTLVWEFERVEFGVSGLKRPLGVVVERAGVGTAPLALWTLVKLAEMGLVRAFGRAVLERAAIKVLGVLGEVAAAFAAGYIAGTVLMSALVTEDKDRAGATTLTGVLFHVVDGGASVGVLVLQRPPDVTLFKFLTVSTSLRDFLRDNILLPGARALGYDRLVVEYVDGDPHSVNVKELLLKHVSGYATIRRVGLVLMVLAWVQPPALTLSDVIVTLKGKMDVAGFEFLGVKKKSEVETEGAALPEELWRRLNVRVLRRGALLGDLPFSSADGCSGGACRWATYSVPAFYAGATDIAIEIPRDYGQLLAEVSVELDVAFIGWLSTTHPYTATVSYSGGAGVFEPESFGVYNLDKIPGYPPRPLAAIQVAVVDSDPPPAAREGLILGDDVLKGMIGGSPYNYRFEDSRLMPVRQARRFTLQYWLYLNISKPGEEPLRERTGDHTQPLGGWPHRVNVVPSTNETVVPPWLNVTRGSVGLALYLNGTYSYAVLPRLLTAYVYTQEAGVPVSVAVWWVIEYENRTSGRWETSGHGLLYNVTVTTPGGRYGRILNVYVGNYSDYAAALARRLQTLVVLRFLGLAVRLDNGRSARAEAPPVIVYPDVQGNLTKDTPTLTVRVYDAFNLSALSGAEVRVDGASGATNSSGMFSVQLPSGSYRVSVSKPGYYNYSTTIYLSRDLLLSVPLVPADLAEAETGWLIVLVRTLDGMPLAGAAVYVNGTAVGETDGEGMWYGLFRWGTEQRVRVSYGKWTSEERSVRITHPRVLTTFTAPVQSQVFKPMVWAYAVYPVGVPAAYGNVTLLAAVVTNSNNTYTVEVGLMLNKTKVSSVALTRTARRPGTDVFAVTLPVGEPGVYVAYLNVTWARADNSAEDNYVESAPFTVYAWLSLHLYVTVEVVKWGKDIPGLIYPGDTVFRVNLTASLTDTTSAANYTEFLRKRAGTKVKLPRPLGVELARLVGTTSFIRELVGAVSLTEIPLGTSVVKSYNITAPFARFMTVAVALPLLANGTLQGANWAVITVNTRDHTVKLPPHLIVKGIEHIDSVPKRVGDNLTVSLRVWTNYLPGEGVGALLMMGFGRAANRSFVAYAVVRVQELRDGEQVVAGKLVVPTSYPYNFTWWEVYKTVDVKFTVGGTPDSYSGDNYVEATVAVLNTGSWFFWLLVVVGVILLVAVLLALRKPVVVVRRAELLQSEWVE
jgi:hypothetical protein